MVDIALELLFTNWAQKVEYLKSRTGQKLQNVLVSLYVDELFVIVWLSCFVITLCTDILLKFTCAKKLYSVIDLCYSRAQ